MNARELVTVLVEAFRASPTRESGSEALYRMHQLRSALEHVLEAVERLAPWGRCVGEVVFDSEGEARAETLSAHWFELLRTVEAIRPAIGERKAVSLGRYLLELITCDHEIPYQRTVSVARFVHLYILKDERALRLCGRCGARKDDDGRGWHRPELLEELGKAMGVLS